MWISGVVSNNKPPSSLQHQLQSRPCEAFGASWRTLTARVASGHHTMLAEHRPSAVWSTGLHVTLVVSGIVVPLGGDAGPDSRNHLNVLTSTIVLALPGGEGTRSEIELAIAYGRPVAVHADWSSQFADLPAFEDAETAIASAHRLLEGIRLGDSSHA